MGKKLISASGLIIIAVIVLAVNLIAFAMFGSVKLDLTEEKLYTLSEGTEEVLGELDEDISAELYYSKTAMQNAGQLRAYADRVIEVLREYEAASDGQFTLEIRDPRPDTETEEWAQRYGIRNIPIATGEQLYLGLVLKNETGGEEVIPFFQPEREQNLEYDITRAIYRVSHPERKTVGVLASLPVMGSSAPQNPLMRNPNQQQRPWFFVRELRQTMNVEEIESGAESIPDSVDLLIVVHPKDLSEKTQYAIDQYIVKGGNAMIFVDPMCDADRQSNPMLAQNPQMMMQASFASDLPNLFEAWGIQMEAGASAGAGMPGQGAQPKVVSDPRLGLEVPTRQGNQKVPVYLSLMDQNLNRQEIVTSDLENVWMIMAGALDITEEKEGLEKSVLMETTEQAGSMESMVLKFGLDPQQLQRDHEASGKKIALALKISGAFPTAFPEGYQEESAEEVTLPEGHVAKGEVPATVIVVSDVDMISDQASVQVQNFLGYEMPRYMNDNLPFLNNAAENLMGSSALIALRSRGRSQRPLTKVQEIQQQAQEKYREQEEELTRKLEEANQRLSQLQRGTDESQVLNQAYMQELRQLREERLETSRALRNVRRQLREDVEALAFRVKFINIALMPFIVVLVGVAVALVRVARRKRKAA